jgi:hypothetical protein
MTPTQLHDALAAETSKAIKRYYRTNAYTRFPVPTALHWFADHDLCKSAQTTIRSALTNFLRKYTITRKVKK